MKVIFKNSRTYFAESHHALPIAAIILINSLKNASHPQRAIESTDRPAYRWLYRHASWLRSSRAGADGRGVHRDKS